MSIKFKKKKVSIDIVGVLIATFACSIFLFIGITMCMYGYVKQRDAEVYSKTLLVSVNDVKEGQIVKFKLTSPYTPLLNAAYTNIPCVFYRIEYISYRNQRTGNNGRGSLTKSIDKVESAPEQITLLSNEDKYIISVNNPAPDCYLKNYNMYRKIWSEDKYQATTKTKFTVGDDVLKESIISQGEEVLLFGRVKNITSDTTGENTIIAFQSVTIGKPLDNIPLFYMNLFKSFFSNELTSFVICTKPETELLAELSSEDKSGMLNTGLIFSLIPLIIILAFWFVYHYCPVKLKS